MEKALLRVIVLLSFLVVNKPTFSDTPLDSSLQRISYGIDKKAPPFEETKGEFIFWAIDDNLQLEMSNFEQKISKSGGSRDTRLSKWWDTFSVFEEDMRDKEVYNAPSIDFLPLTFLYRRTQNSRYSNVKINGVKVSSRSFHTSEFSNYLSRYSIKYPFLEDNIKQNKPIEVSYTKLISVNNEPGSPTIKLSIKKYLLVDKLQELYEADLKSAQANLKTLIMSVENRRNSVYGNTKKFYYLFYASVFIGIIIGITGLSSLKNWIVLSKKINSVKASRRRRRKTTSKSVSRNELLKLGELRNKNLISESDFNQKRLRILEAK